MKNMKKILLVIGGGIAAYKSLDLIRLLIKNGFLVKTILTKSGKEFVTPLSVATISGNKPHEDLFNLDDESKIDHIALSRWADLIVVAPATANFLSKLSIGKADDLASTVLLASNKEILLAPAMNVRMWTNEATINNYKTLISYGYHFVGPVKGDMACGEFGDGKMSEINEIFSSIKNYFKNKDLFKAKKIKALVTAGPTREYIDPVRFITNESSGKQGYEIAKALNKSGVDTTLILGPSNLSPVPGLKIVNVITAKEMLDAVKINLPADIAICSAAVSDFKPSSYSKEKIKKNTKDFSTLRLDKNIDILEFLGKNNVHRPKFVVGFAAETNDLIKNSVTKLQEKRCDMIVANDISKRDKGFNVDFNEVELIYSNGSIKKISKNKKNYIASVLAKEIVNQFLSNGKNLN